MDEYYTRTKNQIRKEAKRMKRLILVCLMALLVTGVTFLPYAHAVDPWQTVTTWINRSWDGAGKLIGQTMASFTWGFTNLGGENYSYTSDTRVDFKVMNGVAYEKGSNSVERRKSDDGTGHGIGNGEESTTITTIKQNRDTRGRLLGAKGSRFTKSWDAATDEDDNGTINSADLAERNYSEENSLLAFSIINAETEVVEEKASNTSYDKEGTGQSITSSTTSTTTRQYMSSNNDHGVTKLTDVATTGKTIFEGQGTVAITLNGDEVKPYTDFATATHYAYDASGNILPVAGNIEMHQEDIDGDGIVGTGEGTLWYNFDPVEDTNANGSCIDEAVYMLNNPLSPSSYSVSYSDGITKGNAGEWENFEQRQLTPFIVQNGMAIPHELAYIEYSYH